MDKQEENSFLLQIPEIFTSSCSLTEKSKQEVWEKRWGNIIQFVFFSHGIHNTCTIPCLCYLLKFTLKKTKTLL